MLNFPCKPMKCKKLNVFTGERIVEVKKDGDRAFVVREGDSSKIFSSIGNDVSQKYPEIIKALDSSVLSDNFILDGEIAAVDGSWESLHKRSDTGESESSVVFNVFDVLQVEAISLRSATLIERKKILAELISDTPTIKQLPFEKMDFATAKAFFEKVVDEGGEGIVAKDIHSLYQPGARNESWIKMKKSDELDCHVIGLTKSDKDGRLFAAIVLARSNGTYLGKAGTGFDEHEARTIVATVTAYQGQSNVLLPNDVRKDILVECKPLWCKVKFQETTGSGSIRHPVWNGFRSDPAGIGKS